ncbi:hypothetical protein [Gordonia paraffinivorans]|uniref:Uncharacterized protein n=2 Tax=Gordonia paraffinivorans TaxID=175628 RepID=A0ABQ0INJ0_9ACTN|nr:hypothetical protein [Gordonia paraffinivorans]GAC85122.1 hypothetical protein GP2_030_00110 [Gordonia paraffinivorans NBRC 108238]VFA89094.1 Uncharacterised protein [Gordonia paraffinivorans]
MSSTANTRVVTGLTALGAVLTALVAIIPFGMRDVLTDHIRHGYPDFTPDEIDTAATAYLGILGIMGAVGVVAWLTSAWLIRRGTRHARTIVSTIFAAAVAVTATLVFIEDTSGEVGLAPAVGWMQLVPCVVGVIVVALLWRGGSRSGTDRRIGAPRSDTVHI